MSSGRNATCKPDVGLIKPPPHGVHATQASKTSSSSETLILGPRTRLPS